MKTLYLHIGTPKTATSAIQTFLRVNRPILTEKGYYYRLMPFRFGDQASRSRNGHFLIVDSLDANGELPEAARELAQHGYNAVTKWFRKTDRVILSEERIWNYLRGDNWKMLENLRDFCEKQGAELKIIVYLRRQDEFLSSRWKQVVSVGSTVRSWEDTLKHPPKNLVLDYYSHLTRIESIVGEGNLIVRRFEKGNFRGNGGTIFSDFLEAIGLEFTDEFTIRKETMNTSIGDNYADLKRILNYLVEEGASYKNDVSSFFNEAILYCSGQEFYGRKYSLFSAQEQKEFLKKYEESNKKVLKKYFPGESVLFSTKLTELPKWDRSSPDVYEDTVLFFGKLLLNQEQRMKALEEQLKELREEVEASRGKALPQGAEAAPEKTGI